MTHMHCCDEVDTEAIGREAMLRLLSELEVGFANNPTHHEAVIARVREAIEQGKPLPTEAFAQRLRGKRRLRALDGRYYSHVGPCKGEVLPDIERLGRAYRLARNRTGAFDELDELRRGKMIRDEYAQLSVPR